MRPCETVAFKLRLQVRTHPHSPHTLTSHNSPHATHHTPLTIRYSRHATQYTPLSHTHLSPTTRRPTHTHLSPPTHLTHPQEHAWMAVGIHREGGSGMPHADMVVVDSQAGPFTAHPSVK